MKFWVLSNFFPCLLLQILLSLFEMLKMKKKEKKFYHLLSLLSLWKFIFPNWNLHTCGSGFFPPCSCCFCVCVCLSMIVWVNLESFDSQFFHFNSFACMSTLMKTCRESERERERWITESILFFCYSILMNRFFLLWNWNIFSMSL